MDVAVFQYQTLRPAIHGNRRCEPPSPHLHESRLTPATAVLARGSRAVCAFVNDEVNEAVLDEFKHIGIGLVALRSAGFNNVDLAAAKRQGITVARVPAYSPEAVSEHAVALILSLDRNIHRAYARVREGNFALEGLLGFNLHGRTIGVVGTGRIGAGVARIMTGFGCKIVAYDPKPDPKCQAMGVTYLSFQELIATSDVVTLHCPLTQRPRHDRCNSDRKTEARCDADQHQPRRHC